MHKTWDDVSIDYTENGREEWNIKDSDGSDYEDLQQFIIIGVLGFCGCGCPEETLAYINIGLRLIAEKPPEGTHTKEGWDTWYTGHRERCDEHFKTQGAEYLFYYFCDFHGLTEHGGSVPGWLTSKGEKLLELINKCENIENSVSENT